jgi:hypothetical protein
MSPDDSPRSPWLFFRSSLSLLLPPPVPH